MATHRISILNHCTVPDASGNCWREPYTVKATNDVWRRLVHIFKNAGSARIGLHGGFFVPKNYVGNAKFIVVWTTTATTNNIVWDLDYRTVAGDDANSLDQTSQEEQVTVTDAAPTAAHRRLEASMTATAGNFAADDEVEFTFYRDKANASDTMAADAILFELIFEYTDV